MKKADSSHTKTDERVSCPGLWKLKIILEAIWFIIKSKISLTRGKSVSFKSNKTCDANRLSDTETKRIVNIIDSILKTVILKSKHHCFHRSYVRYNILIKRNVPLDFHIGLRNLSAAEQTRGHCWLTLYGKLFHEKTIGMNPFELYPISMGNANGVYFWVNGNDNNEILRLKR